VIGVDRDACVPLPGTSQWLKRQMLDADAFAAQHRVETPVADNMVVNLIESPVARLASAGPDGTSFLKPHHVAAAERFRQLVERAQLQPRLTMSYSATRMAGSGGNAAGDMSDFAADARRRLGRIMQQLPADCADVLLDVCGFDKGLQVIETERGWPRRSAKMVLRIGLDALARLEGLDEAAAGPETARQRGWRDGPRPAQFG